MTYDVYCKLVISAYQSGKIDEKTYDTFLYNADIICEDVNFGEDPEEEAE